MEKSDHTKVYVRFKYSKLIDKQNCSLKAYFHWHLIRLFYYLRDFVVVNCGPGLPNEKPEGFIALPNENKA